VLDQALAGGLTPCDSGTLFPRRHPSRRCSPNSCCLIY
jgi:hypothetical protein